MGYEDMSMEELERANTELSNRVAEIKSEQKKINAAMTAKAIEARAQQRLSGMDEAEQAAMKRLLVGGIGGIESKEQVNG